ncbi:MAG: HAD family hydrolase [Balneolaceae bacterium]
MINLFAVDLDGCISYPFKTPSWDAINKIRELNIESRSSDIIPPITICTGRPYPYAEAVCQWLDIRLPFVFESAAVYHWENNRIETALDGSKDLLEPINEMKKWLSLELLPKYPTAMLEFTKMIDAGVIAPSRDMINKMYEEIKTYVDINYNDLEIHCTDVSVNILIKGNNKYQGLKLLGKNLDVTLDQMAYIGDSGGDIKALRGVKQAFAPINAIDEVKKVATVIPLETTEAVLEAYKRVIEFNGNRM